MKKLLSILAVFVVSLLTISMASAAVSTLGSLTANDVTVFVNDKRVTNQLTVEEGELLEIEVELVNDGLVDSEEIEVMAKLSGYDYGDLEDSTDLFSVKAGTTKFVDLEVTVPKKKFDNGENTLRVFVMDRNSQEISKVFKLNVESPKHSLDIKDVVFSPGNTVVAGRSLLTTVLVENLGGNLEEDVKVTLDVPELGVSASEYISEIKADDKKVSEELFLKVPQCAAEGEYTATVTLDYDENTESVSKDFTLQVLANDLCSTTAQKLILTVGPDTQNVVAGEQAVYPVALTNAGSSVQNYVMELSAGDWAVTQMSENLVVLEPGKTKVVYAYLTANEGASGEQVASLTIKSGDNALKTITLNANVVPQDKNFSLRNGLEVALIVLVVILVILGLILGFSRLKRDEDEFDEDGEDKTYY